MDTVLIIVILLIGLTVGMLIVWLMTRTRIRQMNENANEKKSEFQAALQTAHEELESLRSVKDELSSGMARLGAKQETLEIEAAKVSSLREQLEKEKLTNQRREVENQSLEKRLRETEQQFNKMKDALKIEFRNLANDILEEKSKLFTQKSSKDLSQLLVPLQTRINEFEKRVHDNTKTQSESKASLEKQIEQLTKMNRQMIEDAENLTRALKGDSKVQGDWGEVILERVLEHSGLSEGREYNIQESRTNEEGHRLRPDVVVNLPGERKIVIDSKVSLTAYQQYTTAAENAGRERALKQHLDSVRRHISELGAKNYSQLYGIASPDFVLMFIPIEPAMGLAIMSDAELYKKAMDKGIVMVTPSTLLATLLTIESLWKQEDQNRNVMKIAKESGLLYDKFVGFTEDLEAIKKHLDRGLKAHEDATNKLTRGKGNLVRKAEQIKALGAKTRKKLSEDLLDRVSEESSTGAEHIITEEAGSDGN